LLATHHPLLSRLVRRGSTKTALLIARGHCSDESNGPGPGPELLPAPSLVTRTR
jgi:hypothetical protein